MMKTFKIGGVHPHDYKLTAGSNIQEVALPEKAAIPLSQHIGAPAVPVVTVGDKVKVGQLLAKSGGFISANIHSPFSGTITKIAMDTDAWGIPANSIFMDVEGDEWLDDIDRSADIKKNCELSSKEIIQKINDAGIVGLGGACFPTNVKLSPPPGMKAEVLIINGVECEPYLTCDHQLMLEHGEEIFVGIQILMKALNVNHALVGIENNKKDAIAKFQAMAQAATGIEICPLKLKYPQGGEKQLIDAVTGRQVPSGGLPIAVGAVVQNVATTFAVYEAVQKNKPLIGRVMTVTGKSMSKPGNFAIRFGTPLMKAIEMAGGIPEDTGKIIAGGPMMGRAVKNIDVPATKRNSGVLCMPMDESRRIEPENCIRCSKCVDACPMGLEPYLLAKEGEAGLWERMEKDRVMDCIDCGSCLYTCPSHRPLLDYIRMGKGTVAGIIRARKS